MRGMIVDKYWETPELTILARRNSDEVLIGDCRGSSIDSGGVYQGCVTITPSSGVPSGTYGSYKCAAEGCKFSFGS
jgi:hypothetical protein